jgi:UDP-N-acetylmuramoyl-L-alanyl-D-glutamate--2,6-diaminopimelate ligase
MKPIPKINDITLVRGEPCSVAGIALDSRKVEAGDMFIAIPGALQDGRAFIDEAVKRGATALLVPADTDFDTLPSSVAVYTAQNMRLASARLAAAFYDRQPKTIAAITGTSGKTSTAQFTMELWRANGHASASLGTLGLVTPTGSHYGSLTTPDPVTLHKTLDEVAGQGIDHLSMEASSIGICSNRLDFVRLSAAAFTNLSRDHLDFHASMEAYLKAKLRLFDELLPQGSPVVVNQDVPEYEAVASVCRAKGHTVIGFGKNGQDIRIHSIAYRSHGQEVSFSAFGSKHDVLLPVIGTFQVWNSLCALGLVVATGGDLGKTVQGLEKLSGVPGRLQFIGRTKTGGSVFVDYAHKPDALSNVLQGLRPHVAAHEGAKLGVVFGCGGNRDKGKRPMMGEIAQALADWVIVTDDNPRREAPAVIRSEILAACKAGSNLSEIGDRGKAIAEAVSKLKNNDVLVIAGKGHEPGQIIGDKVLPFDDAEVARQAMGVA